MVEWPDDFYRSMATPVDSCRKSHSRCVQPKFYLVAAIDIEASYITKLIRCGSIPSTLPPYPTEEVEKRPPQACLMIDENYAILKLLKRRQAELMKKKKKVEMSKNFGNF